jgi:uncharacterized membrane protein YphA (DoxX/SURF4 family)
VHVPCDKRARFSASLCERTTKTGQGACRTTESETLPASALLIRPRSRLPTTIRATPSSSASATISSAGSSSLKWALATVLFGSFGGPGIEGTAGFHEQIGIKPARPMSILAGLAELVGGILVIAGFLTPLAALALIAVMIVAILKVHLRHGFFAASGGYEFNWSS